MSTHLYPPDHDEQQTAGGVAAYLATRLEAQDNRPGRFEYALISRALLRQVVKFLREIDADEAAPCSPSSTGGAT